MAIATKTFNLSKATVQPTNPTHQLDGWVSPDGLYFPCGSFTHAKFAESIGATVDKLERCGWVHLSLIVFNPGGKLTQAQQDTLFDIMMLNPNSYMGESIKYWLGLED